MPKPSGSQTTQNGHAADAQATVASLLGNSDENQPPLTTRAVAKAWMPFALMSVFLMLTGLIRQKEGDLRDGIPLRPDKFARVMFGPKMSEEERQEIVADAGSFKTSYKVTIPGLHEEVSRAPRLRKNPEIEEPEAAVFNFAWLTAPGHAGASSRRLSRCFFCG